MGLLLQRSASISSAVGLDFEFDYHCHWIHSKSPSEGKADNLFFRDEIELILLFWALSIPFD